MYFLFWFNMAFEIHMLSVGVADAMMIRYLLPDTGYEVIILIDAGNVSDGPKIVKYIQENTQQNYIDLAICTHPDADHIGGFYHVVKKVRIEEFWIHDPSRHKSNAKKLLEGLQHNDLFEKGLKFVVENLRHTDNLLSLIDEKRIRRREPFAGLTYELAPLTVVGPAVSYYERLLGRFRDADLLWEEELLFEKSYKGGELIPTELTNQQILDQSNDQSKENNSSVILLFQPDENKYLFTSDAGPDALNRACTGFNLEDIYWLDVPHHGSRYNLTSALIAHLNPKIAFISCDGSRHYPNAAVVGELKAAGCQVHATCQTMDLKLSSGTHNGYGDVASIPI